MSVLDGNDFKEHGRGTFYKFFTRHFGREEMAKWQSVADWKDAMLKANIYYNQNSLSQQIFRERTSPPLTVASVSAQIGRSRSSADDKEYPPLSKTSSSQKKSSKQTPRSANWKKKSYNKFSMLSEEHDPEKDSQPVDQEEEFPDDPLDLRQVIRNEPAPIPNKISYDCRSTILNSLEHELFGFNDKPMRGAVTTCVLI